MSRRPLGGLAARITLVSLAVALAAIALIAAGVLVVAQATFKNLMIQAGSSAGHAQDMFDRGVEVVFLAAAAIAAVASLVLAVLLARRLARPIHRMALAARHVAEGDYETQLPVVGPDELASLAESLNQMAARLAEQERIRAEFIVNAAHELRTPLTNLQGYLEALRDGVIEPTSEQFRSLQEEVERLVRLARSLEALAAGPASADAAEADTVDVAQAVRSAVELVRPAFDAKAIRCEIQLPGRLDARAHSDQLSQVLSNLLQNASRYTPEAGEVRVVAEPRRGEVLVSVVNTGAEIPPADLPRVFERFYRVEKSRDRARGGAGIGLAIVKQLVEATGGRVGAESQAGVTRFWFSLPG